jgi:hypothetical protein
MAVVDLAFAIEPHDPQSWEVQCVVFYHLARHQKPTFYILDKLFVTTYNIMI